jgi:hypothetical protein
MYSIARSTHNPRRHRVTGYSLWILDSVLLAPHRLTALPCAIWQLASSLPKPYVDKQARYYAEVAMEVECASDEGKSKAAFNAINRLTGCKARTPCGVEADSPADRVKVLQSHFQKLLSDAPPTVVK